MRNLKIKKQIKCEFTPEQWELYTNEYDEKELLHVANDLNESLEVLCNGSDSKVFTLTRMMEELKRYKQYGAYDSEPMYFLERVINEVYGD